MSKHAYIITGASSGLGAEITKHLLSEENYVYCLSRTENDEIKKQASGYKYKYYSIDLTNVMGIDLILQDIFTTIDPENIDSITLINNAASVSPMKHIQYCTQEEIMASIQLNLTAPIMLASSFIRLSSEWCVKRRIVNISSGSAQYPAQSMSLYSSAKSAMNMFSRCVGLEQDDEPNAVQIFAVDPGMMDTEMQKIARDSDSELSEFFSKQKLEGKLSDPAHVARKIIVLNNSPIIKNGDTYHVY